MKRYNVWTLCLVVMGIVCSQTYTSQRVPTTRSAAAGYLRGQIQRTDVSSMTADQYKMWAQDIKKALDVLPKPEQQPFIRSLRNKTDQLDFETITDLQASGINNPMEVFTTAQPASSLPSKATTPAITVRANTYEGIIDELKNRYLAEIDALNIAQAAKGNAKQILNGMVTSYLNDPDNDLIDGINGILSATVANRFSSSDDQLLSYGKIYGFIVDVSVALRNKKGIAAPKVSMAIDINESLKISNAILYYCDQISIYLGKAIWFASYNRSRDSDGIMQLNRDTAQCMAEYIVPVSGTTGNCLAGIVDSIIHMQNKEASSAYAKNMVQALTELSKMPRLASYIVSFNTAISALNNHIIALESAKAGSIWWTSYGDTAIYEEANIRGSVTGISKVTQTAWEAMVTDIQNLLKDNDAKMSDMRKNLGLTSFTGSSLTDSIETKTFSLFSNLINWKKGSDPIGAEISFIINNDKTSKQAKFFALAVLDYYACIMINKLIAIGDASMDDLRSYLADQVVNAIRPAAESYSK